MTVKARGNINMESKIQHLPFLKMLALALLLSKKLCNLWYVVLALEILHGKEVGLFRHCVSDTGIHTQKLGQTSYFLRWVLTDRHNTLFTCMGPSAVDIFQDSIPFMDPCARLRCPGLEKDSLEHMSVVLFVMFSFVFELYLLCTRCVRTSMALY